MYRIAKVLIQPIYCDTIQIPMTMTMTMSIFYSTIYIQIEIKM